MASKFKEGDRVLVNGTQVATVQQYDESTGRLVLFQPETNNTIYGPIGAYRLQLLASDAVVADADETPAEPAAPVDEITTSGSL